MTVSAAVRPTLIELLRFPVEATRAALTMTAFSRSVVPDGLSLSRTHTYRGDADWLLLWGPGAPDRIVPMRRQLAAGGHVIAVDLAYWSRETKFRISIDAAHPHAWVMRRPLDPSRFLADRVPVSNQWDPEGAIVLAGIGRKARAQYGEATVLGWEEEMIARCHARWPERSIIYRPKQLDAPVPLSAKRVLEDIPIDLALGGASLLITWHSNVAVDAIRLGIPVVCRDGAAAAIYPADLPEHPLPVSDAVRDRFLANLAWFQWAPSEIPACWAFLQEMLA